MAPRAPRAAAAEDPASSAPPKATGWLVHGETEDYDAAAPAPLLHLALLAVAVAPLLFTVPPNVAIIATPSLTILVGALRSVKETPPTETMTQKDAMRFPLVGRRVRRRRTLGLLRCAALLTPRATRRTAVSCWAFSCCSSSCPRT